ncbi:MAG: dimethyl sulfoxide reductase anchor subunit [Lysobacter sp.]|nr:MAG: dimethyl sulfoxide reductase anchor subunit [Lysobacter sp.]
MHPALSVIFFTVLSGMGYGLLFWAGVGALAGASPRALLAALMLGVLSATVGLLSSLGHLGKPGRAWRAFSQWRTSWLSREGVAAMLTYVPAFALGTALLPGMLSSQRLGDPVAPGFPGVISAILLMVGALATVACTAMIYASLKPVPAWRDPLVLPVYVAFSLVTGGLAFVALGGAHAVARGPLAVAVIAAVVALARVKRRYWRRAVDAGLSMRRGDAIGLPAREASVFERPHTDGNFVTREMVFVLARRHAHRLRQLAMLLFTLMPALCVAAAWLLSATDGVLYAAAALAALAGTFLERWLFFAEAKHLVSLYY